MAAKIFNVKINIAPDFMKDIFRRVENPYSLRNEAKFESRNPVDTQVVSTSIRRLHGIADVVWTSYRRSKDVLCLLRTSKQLDTEIVFG